MYELWPKHAESWYHLLACELVEQGRWPRRVSQESFCFLILSAHLDQLKRSCSYNQPLEAQCALRQVRNWLVQLKGMLSSTDAVREPQ